METSIVEEIHLNVLNKVALRVGGWAVEAEGAWRRGTVTVSLTVSSAAVAQTGSGCG